MTENEILRLLAAFSGPYVLDRFGRFWRNRRFKLAEHRFFVTHRQFTDYLDIWQGKNEFKTAALTDYHKIINRYYFYFACEICRPGFYRRADFKKQVELQLTQNAGNLTASLYLLGLPPEFLRKCQFIGRPVRQFFLSEADLILDRADLTNKEKVQRILTACERSLIAQKEISLPEQNDLNGAFIGLKYNDFINKN